MFQIVAMLCAVQIAPGDCTLQHGARVVQIVGQELTELACLRQGVLSSGGAALKPTQGEYEKIVCVRKRAIP